MPTSKELTNLVINKVENKQVYQYLLDNNLVNEDELWLVEGDSSVADIDGLQDALNTKANINSPSFTGTPTAPTASAGTNTTQIATTAFVNTEINNKLAANDAMIYKGTLGTGGTVTALPATHNAGWTYKVITAGTYAGFKCEIGDMIICITDGTSSNNAHWSVVQTNIDGAVTGPTSSTADVFPLFNGTTGRVLKNSSYGPTSFAPKTHSHVSSEVTGLATVATSGKYSDLTGTPTIPTVNNAILTIQKNGSDVATFTSNSATDQTANIVVPTGAAADKNVDSSISKGSTSTNLPTSKAVATFVEGKGYKTTDNNYYHTTGSWSGLKYTAKANGGAGELAFTIPTGKTSTTVAVGNHTHTTDELDGGTQTWIFNCGTSTTNI